MPLDTIPVLRDLKALERYLTTAQPLSGPQATGIEQHGGQESPPPNLDLRHDLMTMAAIIARVKTAVTTADGLGPTSGSLSLSELTIRAKRFIVLTELETLRALTTGTRDGQPRDPRCWTPFAGIEDLTLFVRGELNRITHGWLSYRTSAERSAYRSALGVAHAEMRTLGFGSDFARFLPGVANGLSNRPAIRDACTRMFAALMLKIDVDPDVSLLTATFAPPTTGGAHGRG